MAKNKIRIIFQEIQFSAHRVAAFEREFSVLIFFFFNIVLTDKSDFDFKSMNHPALVKISHDVCFFPFAENPYSHLIDTLSESGLKFFNPLKLDDPRYGESKKTSVYLFVCLTSHSTIVSCCCFVRCVNCICLVDGAK